MGSFFEKVRMPCLPRTQRLQPRVALRGRTHQQQRRHDCAQLASGRSLRVLGEPDHGLPMHVHGAALRHRHREYLPHRLKQPLLAVADHELRVRATGPEPEQKGAPGIKIFAGREPPADRLGGFRIPRQQRDCFVLHDGHAVHDQHAGTCRPPCPRRVRPERGEPPIQGPYDNPRPFSPHRLRLPCRGPM